MITFSPSVNPSQGSGSKHVPQVDVIELGDGYVQRVPRSMNHVKRMPSMRWNKLTQAQRAELNDFFTSMGGHIPFKYTMPGEATALSYICKEWSETSSEAALADFTAEFEQTFDNS